MRVELDCRDGSRVRGERLGVMVIVIVIVTIVIMIMIMIVK